MIFHLIYTDPFADIAVAAIELIINTINQSINQGNKFTLELSELKYKLIINEIN